MATPATNADLPPTGPSELPTSLPNQPPPASAHTINPTFSPTVIYPVPTKDISLPATIPPANITSTSHDLASHSAIHPPIIELPTYSLRSDSVDPYSPPSIPRPPSPPLSLSTSQTSLSNSPSGDYLRTFTPQDSHIQLRLHLSLPTIELRNLFSIENLRTVGLLELANITLDEPSNLNDIYEALHLFPTFRTGTLSVSDIAACIGSNILAFTSPPFLYSGTTPTQTIAFCKTRFENQARFSLRMQAILNSFVFFFLLRNPISTLPLDDIRIADPLFCFLTSRPYPWAALLYSSLHMRSRRLREAIPRGSRTFSVYSAPLLSWIYHIPARFANTAALPSSTPLPVPQPPLDPSLHSLPNPPHSPTLSTHSTSASTAPSAPQDIPTIPPSPPPPILTSSPATATVHPTSPIHPYAPSASPSIRPLIQTRLNPHHPTSTPPRPPVSPIPVTPTITTNQNNPSHFSSEAGPSSIPPPSPPPSVNPATSSDVPSKPTFFSLLREASTIAQGSADASKLSLDSISAAASIHQQYITTIDNINRMATAQWHSLTEAAHKLKAERDGYRDIAEEALRTLEDLQKRLELGLCENPACRRIKRERDHLRTCLLNAQHLLEQASVPLPSSPQQPPP